ncbi:hypothetical protein C2S52_014106 [Perilla frutescens var. hirtella]|nr:hypothetical protein C2S52_014106 [Perilla frutescens var. hirtella]
MRKNQQLKDEFGNQVAELSEQIKKLTAQSTTNQPQQRDIPRQPIFQEDQRHNTFEPEFDAASGYEANFIPLRPSITMIDPEFEGLYDPDLYLYWECKVDKIFTCYDFSKIKKVQLVALEFRVHYERELEKKLNRIKQGTRSIEEYHKELETAWNRVGKKESLNSTIIRYIEGMNPDISCEVELRDFTSVDDMVHYASIVERQLREGRHRSHHNAAPTQPYWNKGMPPTSSSTPSKDSTRPRGQSGLPKRRFDRSTPKPSRRPESTSVPPARPQFQWPNQPNAMPNAAPSQSPSEDEKETQADATAAVDTPKVEQEEEKLELPHVSLVSIRSLNINREDEEQSQREKIFYTRVAI